MVSDSRLSAMLTTSEVAHQLHVHINTVRRWSDRGLIRAYRITPRGDRRFKREEIVRFLAELNGQADNLQEAESRQRSM